MNLQALIEPLTLFYYYSLHLFSGWWEFLLLRRVSTIILHFSMRNYFPRYFVYLWTTVVHSVVFNAMIQFNGPRLSEPCCPETQVWMFRDIKALRICDKMQIWQLNLWEDLANNTRWSVCVIARCILSRCCDVQNDDFLTHPPLPP